MGWVLLSYSKSQAGNTATSICYQVENGSFPSVCQRLLKRGPSPQATACWTESLPTLLVHESLSKSPTELVTCLRTSILNDGQRQCLPIMLGADCWRWWRLKTAILKDTNYASLSSLVLSCSKGSLVSVTTASKWYVLFKASGTGCLFQGMPPSLGSSRLIPSISIDWVWTDMVPGRLWAGSLSQGV